MLIDLQILPASSIELQARGELREGLGVWFRGVGQGTVPFLFLAHWVFPFPIPNILGRNMFTASTERTFISVGIRNPRFQSFAHSLKEDKAIRKTLGTRIFPFALQMVTI